jgi:hypothetical protein
VAGLTSGVELSRRCFGRRIPEFGPDGRELVARVANLSAEWSRIASSAIAPEIYILFVEYSLFLGDLRDETQDYRAGRRVLSTASPGLGAFRETSTELR